MHTCEKFKRIEKSNFECFLTFPSKTPKILGKKGCKKEIYRKSIAHSCNFFQNITSCEVDFPYNFFQNLSILNGIFVYHILQIHVYDSVYNLYPMKIFFEQYRVYDKIKIDHLNISSTICHLKNEKKNSMKSQKFWWIKFFDGLNKKFLC